MKTVLVVDDDADARSIFRAALAHAGYEVLVAEDGEEAVRIAVTRAPTLIVMDIMMPRLNGLDAFLRLQQSPQTRPIPVIGITADLLPATWDAMRGEGFADVCAKPCGARQLISVVGKIIGPS